MQLRVHKMVLLLESEGWVILGNRNEVRPNFEHWEDMKREIAPWWKSPHWVKNLISLLALGVAAAALVVSLVALSRASGG